MIAAFGCTGGYGRREAGRVTTKFTEGTPEYYRDRAAQMLKKAEEAGSEEAKNVFLTLAQSWDRMAQQVERPNW